MRQRGRPRLTPEALQDRIADYSARYRAIPKADGLPPFPAGARETPQHREWIAIYKAHKRLARREHGQCERCANAAAQNSIFCEAHRPAPARSAVVADSLPPERLGTQLKTQNGRCPICREKVDPDEAFGDLDAAGRLRGVLDARCYRLVGTIETAGREILDRLRAYLWSAH